MIPSRLTNWTNRQLESMLHLIFPMLCPNCRSELLEGEQVLCTHCRLKLPETHYHMDPENRTAKLFWGRLNLNFAASYLFFRKGALVQKCMFLLKYKNRPDIGQKLGEWYGYSLREANLFSEPGMVIPVPLHATRLAERGYNQAEAIAEGLAEALEWEMEPAVLIRKRATQSQTKKSRHERWTNVGTAFELREADRIRGQHIILVDDVVTTGATVEACCRTLQLGQPRTVSLITLAIAD